MISLPGRSNCFQNLNSHFVGIFDLERSSNGILISLFLIIYYVSNTPQFFFYYFRSLLLGQKKSLLLW